jgi:periplasmic protein TonB
VPDSRPPRFSSSASDSDSWWTRTRENLAQLIAPGGLSASSANGAPIHLLSVRRTRTAPYAQTVSVAMHACVVLAFMLLAFHRPANFEGKRSRIDDGHSAGRIPSRILNVFGAHPSNGSGSGGDKNPIPATRGALPARSSIQLVRPSIPHAQSAEFPIPPTLLDSGAAPVLISIDKVGLPWMREETESGGPGKGHGIGSAGGDSMGDSGDGQVGYGVSGPYANAVSLPTCAYCPLPVYTDEARQVKMQGTVTLRVLVGADGKATDIRVVRGVGYGLDERAIQTVRGWKFGPARDASQRAIPAWIIVEAVFRLF